MRIRKHAAVAAVLAVTTVSLAGVAFAQSATDRASTEVGAAEVFVIAFHADWCGKCRTLGPKLAKDVIPKIKDEPYLFIKLDLTDRNSRQAEYMLAALGLGDIWKTHGRQTGFALVVDAKTQRVLHTLRADAEARDMVRDVRAAVRG